MKILEVDPTRLAVDKSKREDRRPIERQVRRKGRKGKVDLKWTNVRERRFKDVKEAKEGCLNGWCLFVSRSW